MIFTKNSQKVHFSSNYAYNTGHFIDFSPKKSDFSLKTPAYRARYWLFCPIIYCVCTLKIPKKFIFPQIVPIIQGTLLTFLQKKWFFPQNASAYRALFWLFCLIIQCVFTPIIPKKLIFPQIVPIKQGTSLTLSPKKMIFSSKCACISSTILTFLPNNYPLCFYTKNSQKVHFSKNCDTII